MLKIAIIGSRGIPNHYGGFEQFAEYLSVGLTKRNHAVTVYNSHNHPYSEKEWVGVKIIHCFDPEDKWGTAGQFIYDLNCIRHARNQQYDIILQLGYTSSSVWGWLLPKKTVVTTNMDGLEWKRSKYAKPVQGFLKYAERLAVKYSDYLIADSTGIQTYLLEKYKKQAVYIPYGAHVFNSPDETLLNKFNLLPYKYDILIARLEPENSIEIILDGVTASGLNRTFLVIGNHKTKYGQYLEDKYRASQNILFPGAVYDMNLLNNLRYFSNIYFHGHTVGGTNPSLLEAMASQAFICARRNTFNAAILGDDACYFETVEEIKNTLINEQRSGHKVFISNNTEKVRNIYNWDKITSRYEEHFLEILKQ